MLLETNAVRIKFKRLHRQEKIFPGSIKSYCNKGKMLTLIVKGIYHLVKEYQPANPC